MFFFILLLKPAVSQTYIDPSPVGWYTPEEADSLFKINPKPILIDVYTNWCGWCKEMMKTTFANKAIASYINTNFYPVKFDAEGYDTIIFEGKKYVNKGVGKPAKHDFAGYLLDGRYSYPTIVYFDKKMNKYAIPGYMKVTEIEPLLIYFVEEINFNAPYSDWEIFYFFNYEKNYKEQISKIDASLYPDTTGKIKWYDIKDASELSLQEQKPLMIYFYSEWCIPCKVLDGIVLKNPILTDLINNNFYPVKFNAADQNSYTFYGQVFGGTGENMPHKITYALLQQNFKFPAFVFINDTKQKIDEIHGFLMPSQFELILSYFSEGSYLKQSFADFMKTFSGKIKKN